MSRRRRRPDVGAAGAHTRVAWDRRPSAAGGEQDSLAQQGDGSVRCGGLLPFSDRGSPTIGSRRVGGGVEPLAISRAPGATPATRPGQFCKRLDPAGRVLVPHHSRPSRSRRAGGAVSGWSLSRWWGAGGPLTGSAARRREHLVKQGSALLPMAPAPPPAPGHRLYGWICKSPAQQGYGGRDRVEPVTSSVSANRGEALYYLSLSQVGSDRRGGRETLC
jgi:hypothetical protein